MEKATIECKPAVVNALLPLFLKYILISISIIFLGFLAKSTIELYTTITIPNRELYAISIAAILIWFIIPLCYRLLMLHNTSYFFYANHVVAEFRLFNIKRHSVPYHQIVDINTTISFWDRLCKTGDITIHTAEHDAPDLILTYIRQPEIIESNIYKMIQRTKIHQKSKI